MLDLTQMRYFLSAYEVGSFTRAADVLRVSQPSISAAIAKLERQIGGPLFERSRAGLTPTARGDTLFADAAPIVAQLDQLEHRIGQNKSIILRVFCQLDILLGPIAGQLTGYLRQQPDVLLVFTDDLSLADLGFVAQECVPDGFGFQSLRRESYGVAVAQSHALAACSDVTVEALAKEAIIGRPYCPEANRYGQSGLPNVAAQASNDHQLLDLVAAGLGVAIVPLGHTAMHSGVKVMALQGHRGSRTIGLTWRKTVHATAIAKEMCKALGA